jgi:Tn3 transposase DDE domain
MGHGTSEHLSSALIRSSLESCNTAGRGASAQLIRSNLQTCNTSHVVVQRLANSSPSDRLAKALTMLGRIVKSIYILKYLNEEDLRHRVQLQLNRGEHRHSLARWIFFANQGEFRTGDYQEIMNKASCLSLVSNAILVWNTLQIARIVETLRQTGTPIADEDLAHVSPLLHRHVIPNGTYHFPPSYRGGRLVVETLPYVFTARRTPKGAFPSDYAPLYS